MMKKKFCTGKVGKVSFLGAALFSAMCMFSVTVFAGPGDDDDTGGSATGTPEPSFHQLSMQLSLNGVPVNLTPDMQTAIQAIINADANANANFPQQETPSAMPSVTPNVTPQMLNFNDNDDGLDDFFFDDSEYAEFERLCDAPNTAPPTGTDVELSPLDSVDNLDALSDNSSVANQQPSPGRKKGKKWYSGEMSEAQDVVFGLCRFLGIAGPQKAWRKAKIMNLASAYLSCPELLVEEKDVQHFTTIYEKLCQNPELLQKLRSLIGNTDFKNYASQYKDKRLPKIKSNNVLTAAAQKLQHDLWDFAWNAKLITDGSKHDYISKSIAMGVLKWLSMNIGTEHRYTRNENRQKVELLNNMVAQHGDDLDAFFRDPNLKANCAQWLKNNGYVRKPRSH